MNKLLSSVGKVLQKKGYPGLTIGNIATEAQLDKKLIYLYFGTVDHLIETFIKQRDFWNMAEKGVLPGMLDKLDDIGKDDIVTLLQSQYSKFYKDKLFQKLIHWELGEKTPTLRKIADTREAIEEKLWSAAEKNLKKNRKVDFRAALALQAAGIYYLVLHAKTNGSTFCGLDINQAGDKERIHNAIAYMVNLLYADAQGLKS